MSSQTIRKFCKFELFFKFFQISRALPTYSVIEPAENRSSSGKRRIPQAGIAGAEVIDGNIHSEILECKQSGRRNCVGITRR